MDSAFNIEGDFSPIDEYEDISYEKFESEAKEVCLQSC